MASSDGIALHGIRRKPVPGLFGAQDTIYVSSLNTTPSLAYDINSSGRPRSRMSSRTPSPSIIGRASTSGITTGAITPLSEVSSNDTVPISPPPRAQTYVTDLLLLGLN